MATEKVQVVEKILDANDQVASQTQTLLTGSGVFSLISWHPLERGKQV